jgi:hypothetical protein
MNGRHDVILSPEKALSLAASRFNAFLFSVHLKNSLWLIFKRNFPGVRHVLF